MYGQRRETLRGIPTFGVYVMERGSVEDWMESTHGVDLSSVFFEKSAIYLGQMLEDSWLFI